MCILHIYFVLLALVLPSFGTTPRTQGWWVGRPQPYFAGLPTNLTLISGQTAYLTCRVHMLGDRSVTWMRVRDLHILTVGRKTYTADDRFQVLHSAKTDDWTLQLQYTQPRDAGAYKCQVNSDPKIVRNVYLTVTDKRVLDGQLYRMPPTNKENGEYGTYILGGKERFLQAGSSLSLVCVVTHTKKPPTALLWYHDQHVLDYDSPRGGISLQVEKTGEQTTSRLLLSSVTTSDSGNYTCLPVNAPTASVSVHVNSDELRAAVQQEDFILSSSSHLHDSPFLLLLLLVFLLLLLLLHTPGEVLSSGYSLS
ncbi:zwei Ig domain protein zig-8-like [Homarus americanus]|uniref:zwei Ig domain protein zig-8-like n=1 Tax=Homarus americanus TaxID=6706 RepID=UPI001C493F3B|nr:zwei Ig domain protein zig-8-like [Homarus americanus]XP_042235873.1 zwei Ig domain protein zig-8-like [Homarus americanus]